MCVSYALFVAPPCLVSWIGRMFDEHTIQMLLETIYDLRVVIFEMCLVYSKMCMHVMGIWVCLCLLNETIPSIARIFCSETNIVLAYSFIRTPIFYYYFNFLWKYSFNTERRKNSRNESDIERLLQQWQLSWQITRRS